MNRVETLVIGGGQAGLAAGYHLRRRGLPFVIENERVGETPGGAGGTPCGCSLRLATTRCRDHFLDPPRGRVRRKDVVAAGIERVGRTTAVRDGYPLLEDGRVLEVSNVIWCTGYTADLSWIDLAFPTHQGFPIQDRGIVESVPGLYFIGLLFLHSLSSALLGGVGRDAEHIVDHIASDRSLLSGR